LVVPVASGVAALTRPRAVDSKLVGTWTRKITEADVKRAPGALVFLAGKTAKMVVAKSGHFTFDEGLGGNLGTGEGTIVSLGANRIRINHGDPGASTNLYRWEASGRTLTLTKLKDSNPNSVAVFSGAWTSK
jgi:hypothetical protein